jgi:tRNA C32,U32 (ribose-2'-O)-methylase TrmJ
MDEVDFRDRTTGGTHLMTRIRRLFQRCEMDQNEVNILRGILTSVQQKRRAAGAQDRESAAGAQDRDSAADTQGEAGAGDPPRPP